MLFLDNSETITNLCSDLAPVIGLVRDLLIPAIEIGIPIILIVLGMFDLGKAVVASKEDEIKAAQKLLVKRAIYAVAIFFVALVVTAVFKAIGQGGDTFLACW